MVSILKKGASKKDMEAVNKKLSSSKPGKRLDAKKFLGTIKLKADPLTIQKNLRDEWV